MVLKAFFLVVIFGSSFSFNPHLETYYEPETQESAPFLVTNPGQPMTMNDKLLVRPRLLFARTRSKDRAKASSSEQVTSLSEPDFVGKYASWSEYDKTSSPSLHHVTKISNHESSTHNATVTEGAKNPQNLNDRSSSETNSKIAEENLEKSHDENVVKQFFLQLHEISPSDETTSEPLKAIGSDHEDSGDSNKSGLDNNDDLSDNGVNGLSNEEPASDNEPQDELPHEEVSKVEDEPSANHYDEEAGKEGYVSAGYVGPDDVSKSHSPQHTNDDVPRYPPLDREKLYNKSFLIYLKDFRPGQY